MPVGAWYPGTIMRSFSADKVIFPSVWLPAIVIGVAETVEVGKATFNPVAVPDVVYSIANIAVLAVESAALPSPARRTTRLPLVNALGVTVNVAVAASVPQPLVTV